MLELVRFKRLLKRDGAVKALINSFQSVACREYEWNISFLERLGDWKRLLVCQINV